MKFSEGLRNRVSNITRRFTDHMRFAAYIGFSFIIFFHILLFQFLITVYMFYDLYVSVSFCKLCILYCYVCVFLLLCLRNLVIYVLFCVFCFTVLFYELFVCKWVLYDCHRVSNELQLIYHIMYQQKRNLRMYIDSSALGQGKKGEFLNTAISLWAILTLWRRNYYFLISAHSVYKM